MEHQYSSDQLIILLAAAHLATDKEEKEFLNSELEQWITSLKPKFKSEEITNFLTLHEGTPLEPFFLYPADLEFATRLIRVAFSKECKVTRLAIGSSDRVGRGFLYITDNLKGFYSESYSNGKSVSLTKNSWSFFPNQVSTENITSWGDLFKGHAVLKCQEEGLEVLLDWPVKFGDSAALAASFQRNSKVGEDAISLSEVGLRVELILNQLRIVSGSPESMIKLMGMLVRNEILTLDSGYGSVKARLALEAIEEEQEKELKTLFVAKESPVNWLKTKVDLPMNWISEQLKLTASRVLLPHESWTKTVWENI
jgi:hypothetical protein